MAKRVFEDITLTWKGAKYVVPSQHVMRAIARIEDHITLQELMEGMSQRRPKFSKIASAFASVLRFAGCAVEDEEVYDGLLSGADEESPEGISVIAQALTGLLNMMMPPKSMQKLSAVEVGKKGESKRRSPSPKAAANSSPKPTKLATAGD